MRRRFRGIKENANHERGMEGHWNDILSIAHYHYLILILILILIQTH